MSDYSDELINNYNCPDCNEAKLQSDKNARKINEVIDQVNALIQVNNETVDFIEDKANEKVEEIAEIKVNEVLGDLRTEVDNNTKELLYTDNIKQNEIMSKWHRLIKEAKEGIRDDVVYICVGDSTRESNGQHIFKSIQNILEPCNVKCYLHAQSGLKAEHWSETNLVQSGYIKVSNLWGANPYTWDIIPNDGSTTMIDICLGINDMTGNNTETDVYNYIKTGIDKIKSVKPNVLINITSCNRLNSNDKSNKLNNVYKKLIADNNYSFIDVLNNVFQTWYDIEGMISDGTHPNYDGQLKMANYIISKLIPMEIAYGDRNILPINFPITFEENSNADIIKNSVDFVIARSNASIIYLGRFTDGSFYFFEGKNQSISGKFNISSQNRALLTVYGNGIYRIYNQSPPSTGGVWNTTMEFLFKVKDFELLNTLPNGVIVKLNASTLQSKIKFEPIQNQLKETATITRLKGKLDTNDSNYNDIKECGFTCEIIQTGGTSITDFWIRKTSGKWYIMKDQNGNGVIEFKATEGIQKLENVSWSSETLKAKVNILNPSVLDEWNDTSVRYIHIVNAKVNEFSKPINIKDFIIKQSLGLI